MQFLNIFASPGWSWWWVVRSLHLCYPYKTSKQPSKRLTSLLLFILLFMFPLFHLFVCSSLSSLSIFSYFLSHFSLSLHICIFKITLFYLLSLSVVPVGFPFFFLGYIISSFSFLISYPFFLYFFSFFCSFPFPFTFCSSHRTIFI